MAIIIFMFQANVYIVCFHRSRSWNKMIWHKNIIEFYFGIFWFLTKIFRLWFIIVYVIKIFRVEWLNLSHNFKWRYIAKHDYSLSKCALICYWRLETMLLTMLMCLYTVPHLLLIYCDLYNAYCFKQCFNS